MKTYKNKEYFIKRVADNKLFQLARLQSWFQDRKEQYQVVDKGQQVQQQCQAYQAAIQDASKESDDTEPNADDGSDREQSQDEVDDQIV